MGRQIVLVGILAVGGLVAFAGAQQQDFSKVQIKTEKLADNLYVLFGEGGNIGLSAGPDGAFLIDDQYAPLTDKILAAVKAVSPQPVRYVVNTHWHDDHVHVPPAHTDGDAIVHFRKGNVVHMGDLYFTGMYPFIDLSSGGSVDGMIGAAERALKMVDARTRIIPGHGPMGDQADLRAYRNMLVTVRDRVRPMVKAGRSLAESARPRQRSIWTTSGAKDS